MIRSIKKLIFCFLFIFLSFAENAFSIEVYVSPTGKDSNKGNKESPLLTLTGARDKIRQLRKQRTINEPVYVIVENGIYYMSKPLELSSEDSGTPQSPVIFIAAKGAAPVFYGGIELKGFKMLNDQLWKADIPQTVLFGWYFEQLFVNDKRAQRAKSPDNGFYYIKNTSEKILEKKDEKNTGFAIQEISIDSTDAMAIKSIDQTECSDVVLNFYHKWDYTRKPLHYFNSDSLKLYTEGKAMKPWNKIEKNSLYSVENYRKALTMPGEWFLSRKGELLYIPLPGETIENTRFTAPTNDQFIVINGDEGKKIENIRFENLSFKLTRYQTGVNGKDPVQAAADVEGAVMVDFANNISFINCQIVQTANYAIWFRKACSNCTIQHCLMQDLGAGGIKIGEVLAQKKKQDIYSDSLKYDPIDSINFNRYLTHHIKVDNNIITGGGKIFPAAVGICIFNGADNTLTHNEISDLYYSGISVGWVWGYSYSASKRNTIAFNHIHHLGWGVLSDMGGIYTLGPSEGTIVSNNTLHDISAHSYGGWGLYTDEGSTGILMENNLVYNCKSQGFHQHFGRNNIIRNNIFAFNEKAQLAATRVEKHLSFNFTNNIIYYSNGNLTSNNWSKVNIVSDNNCYWETSSGNIAFDKYSFKDWQNLGKDQHSVIENPMFIAAESYNFGFKNLNLCNKIGFKPFNYSLAGVYGSNDWKKKAEMKNERIKQFSPEFFPKQSNKL
ncbi:right-handed parallel beta-helix repeat-containing protein [Solitalea koreensis]|uniref:Parallel beta-helix repeat (Two copies) n=1 Tax=Solitalea koreensis TaxID=543615 RepID=A0A521DYI3_9SPHI|nr:right-handed parallel beta-helix repeat-containing protein [Solitalea koreensis]SMO75940.1 parallel beta-helix repeat (two copies) [Solitalea koreensis]